jgi:hypothetical protein
LPANQIEISKVHPYEKEALEKLSIKAFLGMRVLTSNWGVSIATAAFLLAERYS